MKKLTNTILVSTVLSTALWAAPAFANPGEAKEGNGEATRAAPMDIQIGRAKPITPPKLEGDEASRAAPITDEAKAVESLSVMTRSAKGDVTTTAPSEEVRALVIDSLKPEGEQKNDGKKLEKAGDPALTEGEEANRQVFGPDDRVQIKNTKVYPFTTIGYIEGKTKKGEYGSCSGALIGPRTVLTAAHCLFSNEQAAENGGDGWLTDIIFAPGLNGPEDAPFGAYQAESTSIIEGFVKNYQGFYGSVIQWDMGIITLAEPIGDNLGWLGYANYDDLGDFDANIVGYPGDKPAATMWRATCPVTAEAIGADNFEYLCDTYPGSSGSSVYAYDQSSKQRIVLGVNIAESKESNTAIRLNAANVAWINSLWK